MLKVFLVLSVLSGGQWEQLTDEPRPFDSIDECVAAAGGFLNSASEVLKDSGDALAVSANCIVGKVPADGK